MATNKITETICKAIGFNADDDNLRRITKEQLEIAQWTAQRTLRESFT